MRVIDAVPGSKIFVGHQGDNEATMVRFDARPFYDLYGDDGTFTVYVQRYGETDGYPVGGPLVSADDDYVYWTLASADTAVAGTNECQLRYAIDDTVVMSLKYDYQVQESVVMGTTVPAPMEEWAAAIIAAVSEVVPMPDDVARVPSTTSADTFLVVDDEEVKQIAPGSLPIRNTTLGDVASRVTQSYYDADTDRTVVENRLAAIKYAVENMLGGKSHVGFGSFGIRYANGYYYSYFTSNPATGSAQVMTILEINPHSAPLEYSVFAYYSGDVHFISGRLFGSGSERVTASTTPALVKTISGMPSGWKIVQAQLVYNGAYPTEINLTADNRYAQATAVKGSMTQQLLSVQLITNATTVYVFGAWGTADTQNDVLWQWFML